MDLGDLATPAMHLYLAIYLADIIDQGVHSFFIMRQTNGSRQ